MSKVVVGSIPEKICYVYSVEMEVPVGFEWDITYDSASKTKKIKVLPTFPVDNSDHKQLATANYWAEHLKCVYPNKNIVSTKIQNNTPIKDIKVVSLKYRGQSGRAYKALIDNFYVDLREDVLMDTLLQVGILPGGILQGEYIWAKVGSQIKLVRVNSELYNIITEYHSKKDIKPVGKKELEIGGVYQTRKKDRAIFLGYVNTTVYSRPESFKRNNNYYPIRKPPPASFNFDKKEIKKALLFCQLYNSQEETIEYSDGRMYRFRIKKSHNYIEKINKIAVDDDAVEKVRSLALKNVKEKLLKFSKDTGGYSSYDLEATIEYYSENLNMYRFDKEPCEQFDIKKYLMFI